MTTMIMMTTRGWMGWMNYARASTVARALDIRDE